MRVRFELKSPVKTIEDFLRRFTPSRLTLGGSSVGSASMAAKSAPKASLLSTLANDGALLRLEERLGPGAPCLASNGYSSAADSWAAEQSATGPEPGAELRYEAESPDEAALVHAARAYSCALVGRLHDQVSVELPHLGRLTFELLHTLGFDSIRKRMSVVIRHPLTDEINVYTKGADSVVMDLLLPCSTGTCARGQLPATAVPEKPAPPHSGASPLWGAFSCSQGFGLEWRVGEDPADGELWSLNLPQKFSEV